MVQEIRRYDRPDGKQVVRLVQLDIGYYSFTVENEFWEEPHPAIGDGYAYSTGEMRGDGLYVDLETAERDIALKFSWITSPA